MRVKKTRWPIVIAGIVLAAILSSLGVVQAQQITEKNRLDSEITSAEESLAEFQPSQGVYLLDEMEESLSETSDALDETKAQLSESTDSIEANDILFNIAAICGVVLNDITISSVSTENLVDVPCTTLSVTTIVKGGLPQLLDFVLMLNTDVTNGVVESVRISVPLDTEEQEQPKADVKMVIYYYEDE
ncbi:MAG TPA: hypothetical protein G4O07_04970 [Dehalococcoidia bacterium]|nr:hypothetical protein [Dehalococcoidia bacterium]